MAAVWCLWRLVYCTLFSVLDELLYHGSLCALGLWFLAMYVITLLLICKITYAKTVKHWSVGCSIGNDPNYIGSYMMAYQNIWYGLLFL